MTRKLDMDTLRYITALEDESGAEVKDCISLEEELLYVISEGQLGMAIGKQGANAKKLTAALGKRIRLIEYAADPIQFASRIVSPAVPSSITLETNEANAEQTIVIESDFKNRGTILGKGGAKVQILKDLLKRHHQIQDVIIKDPGRNH